MKELLFTLIRSPRRKTVDIVIKPDNTITVRAPERLSDRSIHEIVEQKSAWIREKMANNLQQNESVQPKSYRNGEEFLFLGKRYILEKVAGGSGVALVDGTLCVGIPRDSCECERSPVVTPLHSWYRGQALHLIAERILFWRKRMNVSPRDVKVKKLKSRWGSCSQKGNVNFNWLLVLAPMEIVDYVVVHELCHLLHPNHSPAFWELVESMVPDYRERRKWLRTNTKHLTV